MLGNRNSGCGWKGHCLHLRQCLRSQDASALLPNRGTPLWSWRRSAHPASSGSIFPKKDFHNPECHRCRKIFKPGGFHIASSKVPHPGNKAAALKKEARGFPLSTRVFDFEARGLTPGVERGSMTQLNLHLPDDCLAFFSFPPTRGKLANSE